MTDELEEQEPLLPEIVHSVFGDIPYAAFKEKYQQVYDQVEDMSHLLMGRLKFSTSIGKINFTVKSLKQSESAILASFFPTESNDSETAKKLITFEIYKVAMCLLEINGQPIPEQSVRLDTSPKSWLENTTDLIDTVSDYDSTLLSFISNTYEDMTKAKQYAFIELMPRP